MFSVYADNILPVNKWATHRGDFKDAMTAIITAEDYDNAFIVFENEVIAMLCCVSGWRLGSDSISEIVDHCRVYSTLCSLAEDYYANSL